MSDQKFEILVTIGAKFKIKRPFDEKNEFSDK